jgi:hypothetical protein
VGSPEGAYGPLVPRALHWGVNDGADVDAVECLRVTRRRLGGSRIRWAAWITAPAPHRRWGSPRWLISPDGTGTLNQPEVLELTLKRAAGKSVLGLSG